MKNLLNINYISSIASQMETTQYSIDNYRVNWSFNMSVTPQKWWPTLKIYINNTRESPL